MTVWSYLACVTTDPGRVPEGWMPFADEAVSPRPRPAPWPARGSGLGACRRRTLRRSRCPSPARRGPAPSRPTRPAAAPPREQTAQFELDRIAAAGPYGAAGDKSDPRRPRFCKHCRAWKPERAHHCSVSGHCVLQMDHYCIWVGGPCLTGV